MSESAKLTLKLVPVEHFVVNSLVENIVEVVNLAPACTKILYTFALETNIISKLFLCRSFTSGFVPTRKIVILSHNCLQLETEYGIFRRIYQNSNVTLLLLQAYTVYLEFWQACDKREILILKCIMHSTSHVPQKT